MDEIFVPIVLFAIVPLIVWIVSMNGQKRAADLQITVQKAIEKGIELTPDTIKALGVKPRSPFRDLRWGAILLASAGAFLLLGRGIQGLEGHEVAGPIMVGIASFPGLIGLALIVMHFLLRDKADD